MKVEFGSMKNKKPFKLFCDSGAEYIPVLNEKFTARKISGNVFEVESIDTPDILAFVNVSELEFYFNHVDA